MSIANYRAVFWRKREKTGSGPDPDLERRLLALEKRLDKVDYEWTEWFDKFRRLHARLAKREQRTADDEPEGTAVSQGDAGQLSLQELDHKIKAGLM